MRSVGERLLLRAKLGALHQHGRGRNFVHNLHDLVLFDRRRAIRDLDELADLEASRASSNRQNGEWV